ncbi:GL23533 [Drosophila persimilis]|uniref:GL23533 n=1 Tax=Drosophila persimilis TaxID=7234 RepID=B4G2W6_DROPE|nr:GL23533 [Drosophila persimilis]
MSGLELRISGRSVWAATLLLHFLLLASGVDGFGMNLMTVPNNDKSQGACILALLRKYFDSGDGLSGSVLCISRNYQLHNVSGAAAQWHELV